MRILRSFPLVLFFFICLQGFTQVNHPDPIVRFGETITPNDLKAHVDFLASPELEGRETATRGQKVAAQYIAANFRRLGLKPPVISNGAWSYFQEFIVRQVQVKQASITLYGKKKFNLLKDFVIFRLSSFPRELSGDLVFAGYGIESEKYNNIGNMALNDKIVVVLDGEPVDENGISRISGTKEGSEWSTVQGKKQEFLQSRGAKAVIVILKNADYDSRTSNNWVKRMYNRPSMTLVDPMRENPIPVIYIHEVMATELMKYGKMKLPEAWKSLNEFALVPDFDFRKTQFKLTSDATISDLSSENVLGYLEGTDKKDELVVITAHYDHLGIHDGQTYYGADDDGSGTASVLEIAEAFSLAAKNGSRPRRSILFMPVAGEEKGLLGSSFYTDHPVFPLKNTVVDLNIDMIGRTDEAHDKKNDSLYVYIIGSDKLSSQLHASNDSMNRTYTRLNLDYTYNQPDDPNRFYYRSDHYNFAKNNIPVIFYFTGVHVDYHKPTDTPDKIRFPKMTEIVKLVFATAWDIANREERLVVDRKSDFENNR